MRLIRNTSEFLAVIGSDGKVAEPVTLSQGCVLYDLTSLTSLDGVTLAQGCVLRGLNALTSLDGVTLSQGCELYDLTSLTSLDGVTLAQGCVLRGLNALTSLDGVTLSQGCELYDLTSLTSLDGVTLAQDCALNSLNALTSLDGVTLAQGCRLHGMPDTINLIANPSAEEMVIIKQIPADDIQMSSWHCGTSHCLAGWAQVISGREISHRTAYKDGSELLPSLAHLFFAPDAAVKRLIIDLQSR